MADPTTERIDALLQELDQLARDYDSYEYGLPLHTLNEETGAPLSKLRDAVRAWLAHGVPVLQSAEPPLTVDEAKAVARRVLVNVDEVSLLTGVRIVQETQLALRKRARGVPGTFNDQQEP